MLWSTLTSKYHKIDFKFPLEENSLVSFTKLHYSNTERTVMFFKYGWYEDNQEIIGLISHKNTSCMKSEECDFGHSF